MGKEKALIEIDGVPIIQRIHTLLKRLFQETIIVTNQTEIYQYLDAKLYTDLIPNVGVLGGLYTGLFFSSFHYSFCVACDMPFLKESVIQYLLQHREGHDVVVPRTKDGLQPLHAIYSKNCMIPIKKLLERNQNKLIDIYPMVDVKILDETEFSSLDPMRESFININTPEDLLRIKTARNLR